MRKLAITLFFMIVFLFVSLGLKAHDLKMAILSFTQVNNQIKMSIRFDKEDLLEKVLYSDVIDPFAEEKIVNYINSNLATQLNAKALSWHINEIKFEDETVTVEAVSSTVKEEIKSMNVSNTLLVNQIPDHRSLIHFNFKNKRRSFKMDENRTEIDVVY